MNLFAARKRLDSTLLPLMRVIGALPIAANQWTFLGACLGIAGGALLWNGQWWLGVAALVVRGLLDLVDGYVARAKNQRSIFGAVMDDVCDRWVLGIMYAGGCLAVSDHYPHVLMVMAFGITGALTNVIIKLSVYAEAGHDVSQATGKTGHPIDVVGAFGSAEFVLYFGAAVLAMAISRDARCIVAGAWAVALLSHFSLLQRIIFVWKRYRSVNPDARTS